MGMTCNTAGKSSKNVCVERDGGRRICYCLVPLCLWFFGLSARLSVCLFDVCMYESMHMCVYIYMYVCVCLHLLAYDT